MAFQEGGGTVPVYQSPIVARMASRPRSVRHGLCIRSTTRASWEGGSEDAAGSGPTFVLAFPQHASHDHETSGIVVYHEHTQSNWKRGGAPAARTHEPALRRSTSFHPAELPWGQAGQRMALQTIIGSSRSESLPAAEAAPQARVPNCNPLVHPPLESGHVIWSSAAAVSKKRAPAVLTHKGQPWTPKLCCTPGTR